MIRFVIGGALGGVAKILTSMRDARFGPLIIGLLVVGFLGIKFVQKNAIYLPRLIASIKDPISPPKHVLWESSHLPEDVSSEKPNIVLIMVDDLGYNVLSFEREFEGHVSRGRGLVPTPHIDSIGYGGINFAQAYSAAATCAPSRAGLLTGRYPTRFGFEFTPGPSMAAKILHKDYTVKGRSFNPALYTYPKGEIPHHKALGLPKDETTFPQLLQGAGYRTLMVGKWHLGAIEEMQPHNRGFDEFVGFMPGQAHYLKSGDPNLVDAKLDYDVFDHVFRATGTFSVRDEQGDHFEPSEYMTDYFSNEAVKAIEANKNRPFFLFLSYNAPHTPLQALKIDYDALDHIEDHRTRVYAAMVKAVDRGVGEVLDKLEQEGLSENTLVIFTSDNGGSPNVGIPSINEPLRGWKATLFEGGVRVPLFMKWPDTIEPGTKMDKPIAQLDLFATIADASGFKTPSDIILDSQSLLQEDTYQDTLFWKNGTYRAYRKGDWKLHWVEKYDKIWMFNLKNDPTERLNLAASEPEKFAEMMADMVRLDEEQAKPAWPIQVEAPIAIDLTKENELKDRDDFIIFSN